MFRGFKVREDNIIELLKVFFFLIVYVLILCDCLLNRC